jgi:molybdenum cofactor synthesis domain-containing protein
VLIVTLSDRASKGEYSDMSGPMAKEMLSVFLTEAAMKHEIETRIIPDDALLLEKLVRDSSVTCNLIITTGGTGIGPRDITVETVRPLLSREIPGVMEYIRIKFGSVKPAALLSRGVAGIIGNSLIYTLPGSPKAVEEYLGEIMKTLLHTVNMQYGIDKHT